MQAEEIGLLLKQERGQFLEFLSAYEYRRGTGQKKAEEDLAREIARIDLPMSTYTQWYWKIDLHNLLHFLTLRVDTHAQWEIQEIGRASCRERV